MEELKFTSYFRVSIIRPIQEKSRDIFSNTAWLSTDEIQSSFGNNTWFLLPPKKLVSKSELNLWARTNCVSLAKLQTARSQLVQIRIFFPDFKRVAPVCVYLGLPFHTFSYNIPASHKSPAFSKITLELTDLSVSKMSQKLSSSVSPRDSAQSN